MIDFDNYKGPTINNSFPLQKTCRNFMNGTIKVTRFQFALNPAYASTIHKAQGLTISQTVIDLTPQSFSSNLAYTAVTRVRSLKNLLISNLPTLNTLNKINNIQKHNMRIEFSKNLRNNKFKLL